MHLLSNFTADVLQLEPFPHLVVKRALPQSLCNDLIKYLPPVPDFTEETDIPSNTRYDINASSVLQNESQPKIWRDFVAAHTNSDFYRKFLDIFESAIRAEYPDSLAEALLSLDTRTGVRNIASFASADILLESQIAVNTPVYGEPTSVRGAHLDAPNKLYTGLFYLRDPNDNSEGGHLELQTTCETEFGHNMGVASKYTKAVRTVKYEANTLVLFLNTPRSLHAVTARSVTNYPRYFMNLNATWKEPLFSVDRTGKRPGRNWSNKIRAAGAKLRGLVANESNCAVD